MKEIPLAKSVCVLVSEEDYAAVSLYKWRLDRYGYARTSVWDKDRKGPVSFYLHHLVLPKKKGFQIDHINQDKLDNRRENLRYATHSQNSTNKKYKRISGFRGVSRSGNAWVARASKDHVRHERYGIKTQEEAVKVYNELAKELHGEFAVLHKI